MGLLLSTISSGLLFGAQDGPARYFAMGYAFVYVPPAALASLVDDDRSAAVLVYGYVLYQSRLTRISARDPGNFGGSRTFLLAPTSSKLTPAGRYARWPIAHLRGAVHRHSRQLHFPLAGIEKAHGRQPDVVPERLGSGGPEELVAREAVRSHGPRLREEGGTGRNQCL